VDTAARLRRLRQEADGEVGLAPVDVDDHGGRVDIDGNAAGPGLETAEARQQPAHGEKHPAADGEARGGPPGEIVIGRRDAGEAVGDRRDQRLRLGQRLHPARGAPEERDAELGLQIAHVPADRRMGQRQLVGRMRDVAQAADGLEGAQRVEREGATGHDASFPYIDPR
jgi:hypothetical protein